MINLYQPHISFNEFYNVTKSLFRTNISGMSSPVREFELSFQKMFGFKHCLATNSGTAALHLALIASGINQNDEVILPSITFISTANAVSYTGATPVIVDIDRDTYQISIDDIEKNITNKTKAIIPVHLYGNCPNLDKLTKIAKKYNLKIIHDTAEALGTKYRNKESGMYADVAIYSFYPNKVITTGEGGMLVTNNDEIFNIAKVYRGQGLRINTDEYKHDVIGFNYRMPALSASLGIAQLKNFSKFLYKKKKIHERYKEILSEFNISFIEDEKNVENSFWLTVLDFKNITLQVDDLRNYLKSNMIETKKIFYPLELQKPYISNKLNKNAINLYENALCVPSHPKLKIKEIEFICKKIANYINSLN